MAHRQLAGAFGNDGAVDLPAIAQHAAAHVDPFVTGIDEAALAALEDLEIVRGDERGGRGGEGYELQREVVHLGRRAVELEAPAIHHRVGPGDRTHDPHGAEVGGARGGWPEYG